MCNGSSDLPWREKDRQLSTPLRHRTIIHSRRIRIDREHRSDCPRLRRKETIDHTFIVLSSDR